MTAFRMKNQRYREQCPFLSLGSTKYRQPRRDMVGQKTRSNANRLSEKTQEDLSIQILVGLSEHEVFPSKYGTGSSP